MHHSPGTTGQQCCLVGWLAPILYVGIQPPQTTCRHCSRPGQALAPALSLQPPQHPGLLHRSHLRPPTPFRNHQQTSYLGLSHLTLWNCWWPSCLCCLSEQQASDYLCEKAFLFSVSDSIFPLILSCPLDLGLQLLVNTAWHYPRPCGFAHHHSAVFSPDWRGSAFPAFPYQTGCSILLVVSAAFPCTSSILSPLRRGTRNHT